MEYMFLRLQNRKKQFSFIMKIFPTEQTPINDEEKSLNFKAFFIFSLNVIVIQKRETTKEISLCFCRNWF